MWEDSSQKRENFVRIASKYQMMMIRESFSSNFILIFLFMWPRDVVEMAGKNQSLYEQVKFLKLFFWGFA